jgi:tetratricopeptide (TPR) repeat protein
MKSIVRLSILSSCIALLLGCAAAMVPYTSDPAIKLGWSKVLLEEQDRPIPAERLIFEAIDIYKAQKDENGLAEAYRRYGIFLKSPSVRKWGDFFIKNGFLDKTVTFNTRLDKSIEYFNKAKSQFENTKSYDMVSNVYLQLAFVYDQKGEHRLACKSLDSSLENNVQYKNIDPAAQIQGAGDQSYDDKMAALKKAINCQ